MDLFMYVFIYVVIYLCIDIWVKPTNTHRLIAITPSQLSKMPFPEARKICLDYTVTGLETMTPLASTPFRFLYTSGANSERDATKKPWVLGDFCVMRVCPLPPQASSLPFLPLTPIPRKSTLRMDKYTLLTRASVKRANANPLSWTTPRNPKEKSNPASPNPGSSTHLARRGR